MPAKKAPTKKTAAKEELSKKPEAQKPGAKKPLAKKPLAKRRVAKKAPVKKAGKLPAKGPARTKPRTAKAKAAAPKAAPKKPVAASPRKTVKAAKAAMRPELAALMKIVATSLDDDKAENIVTIDLEGRSSLADALVIATGRSSRHVAAIAEHLVRRLKEEGYGTRPADGLRQGDWVLVDGGDVIVHIFRPEVRLYYDLEGMWSVAEPERVERATTR